jgi:hypothetical protein
MKTVPAFARQPDVSPLAPLSNDSRENSQFAPNAILDIKAPPITKDGIESEKSENWDVSWFANYE